MLRRSFTRPAIHAPLYIFHGPATAVPDRSGVERSQDGDCSALIWYITEDLLPKSLAITSIDSDFSGSSHEVYDSYLVPILFEGYAYDLADRGASSDPTAGLDVSAGSGALPRALAPRLNGGCCYVVTDITRPCSNAPDSFIRMTGSNGGRPTRCHCPSRTKVPMSSCASSA